MVKLLVLGFAGALGTLARVGLSSWLTARLGATFPWGTLAVNLVGSLAFGAVWAAAENRGANAHELRFYLLAGFMGAFTTFSSLVFEVAALLSAGRTAVGLLNLVLQNVLGLVCVGAGLALGRNL